MHAAVTSAFTHVETTPLPATMFKQSVGQLPVHGYLDSMQSIIISHLVAREFWFSRHSLHGAAGGNA